MYREAPPPNSGILVPFCLFVLSPTHCDPMDCSPPGSSVHRIFQARILECIAISFSRGSSQPRDQICISCVASGFFTSEPPGALSILSTPWTVAYQAPLSMGFSRQEYWSGLPFPSPGVLPNPGIEPGSPTWKAEALTSEPPGKP